MALGLGSIQVYSHLDQPLRADIELLAIAHDTVSRVHAALASPEDFDWIGLERDPALEDLAFTPLINSKGKPVIRVTSSRPITKPRLDLLLDVRWSNRHLLREYTMQIKAQAPISSDQPGPIIRPAKPPLRAAAPTRPRTPVKAPTPASQPAPKMALSGDQRRYRTVPGDTLSGIAKRYAPQGPTQWRRMTQALFAANPHAFLQGDIDRLMAGVVLRIPRGEELARLGRPQPRRPRPEPPAATRNPLAAVAAALPSPPPARQNAPRDSSKTDKVPPESTPKQAIPAQQKSPPRLEIVSDQDTEAQSGAAVARSKAYLAKLERTVTLAQELAESRLQEVNELKGRIRSLEGVIAKQDRLITLQSEQLTKLIERSEAASPPSARPSTTLGLWLLGSLVGLMVVLAVLVLRLYLRR